MLLIISYHGEYVYSQWKLTNGISYASPFSGMFGRRGTGESSTHKA
jgi:hypothetical protein